MAGLSTPVFQGQNMFITDITWGLDADVALVVAHGLGVAPLDVQITPTAGGAAAFAALGQLFVSAIGAVNFTINKVGTAGTAIASSCRITVRRPHSITQ